MKSCLPSFKISGYRIIAVFAGLLLFNFQIIAESKTDPSGAGKSGITVLSQSSTGIRIHYAVGEYFLKDVVINGESVQSLELPGCFLPAEAGSPNLPGSGRYIAVPQGAIALHKIVSARTETLSGINLAPAIRIPLDTDSGPLDYSKNESVYSKNAMLPENPFVLSDMDIIRGIDVVMLGITPFQYNPVTKELVVYHDILIEVTFEGGNGHFGDDRLRSRWWDPMLSDMLLNYESLPKMDYNHPYQPTDETGCEYLIVSPNAMEFQQWADSVRKFRNEQGILTDVVTLAEVGGNTAELIESYIDNAYNTWDIPPVACLLLGDYGSDATSRVISPVWNNYCVSDNIYADVNNNDLPDIICARITAKNELELQIMVSKFLNNERTPPTNEDFYYHPITSLGWDTDNWFQICSEVIGGFWREELGKDPVRINTIISGTPDDVWSTAPNTDALVSYFGPDGLGYIPEFPSELGGWTGGNADLMNDAINSGAFMLQHRDHGTTDGWVHPLYTILNVNALENTDLPFLWSIDCLTGKFNYSTDVFAEKLYSYTHKDANSGCFGINAASEISYSFVNDIYVWGAFDNMWTDFLPDYGSNPEPRGILPAFGCAAGKYFLNQSTWVANPVAKTNTFHLFHHFGDAFTSVFSELPQALTVTHSPYLYLGETTFEVTADEDALIGLSVNGQYIGSATGTGSPVIISIPPQAPPDQVLVTVTKQNFFRYQGYVDVLPATGPYVVHNSIVLDDASGNGNGIMETSEFILASITVENVGVEDATNVIVSIATDDIYVTLTDNSELYGNIPSGSTSVIPDGFAWEVANNIPDLHIVDFELTASDGTSSWVSEFSVTGHAPLLEFGNMLIDDYIGNANGRLDPGETAFLIIPTSNNGSYNAAGTVGTLSCSNGFVTLNNTTFNFNDIGAGLTEEAMFSVTIAGNAPAGTYVNFMYQVTSGGYFNQQTYPTIISMVVEDWETGDMSQFDWITGGDSDWQVSTQNPHEGSFCIKSGELDDNGSNFLSLQFDALGTDSLSFWVRVSSESGFDLLKFFIDDNELSTWSGELDWDRASYLVTVGTHTFKWEYIKDESITSGDDCVWIDFIILPAAVYEAAFISDVTDICEGETVGFIDQSPEGTISWNWEFEGGNPATSTLQNPVIVYPASGTFDVTLVVSNGSATDTLEAIDYITVSALPEEAPAPAGPESVCGNTLSTSYSTSGISGITVYSWLLDPAGAGNVTGTGLSATVNWTTGFLGNATLSVAGQNICGTGTFSDLLTINRYLPEVTLEPFDTICVYWPAFELTGGMPEGGTYSGPGVDNGWFDPSIAGLGTHTITYTFVDPNNCDNFATETILVDPCTGITENNENAVRIYPNPANGQVTISYNQNCTITEVRILNALNKVVYSLVHPAGNGGLIHLDLQSLDPGVYFIKIKTDRSEEILKIILH